MNDYQLNLYHQLMNLCANSDSFFFKDHILDDVTYRIFNYRLVSWSEFQQPGAIECRGIMFEISSDKVLPVRLACHPMHKFHNFGEGDSLTYNYSPENVDLIMDKLDGSLISSYLHKGQLRLKSKTSLDSDQAVAAMKWLDKLENYHFRQAITLSARSGYTTNMEYTGPDNRIVIGYPDERLTILNIRDCVDGHYMPYHTITRNPDLSKHLVYNHQMLDTKQFVLSIPDMSGDIEGFIFVLKTGQWTKHKTEAYIRLHHAKDGIDTPRRLFECIINEEIDDLRSLFINDPVTITKIEMMEAQVIPKYNQLILTIDQFYEDNKHLSRKEYAILGTSINDGLFALKMTKYLGKTEPNYKEFATKHPEYFGIGG
jgi:T4 RnlA family RNA ligase